MSMYCKIVNLFLAQLTLIITSSSQVSKSQLVMLKHATRHEDTIVNVWDKPCICGHMHLKHVQKNQLNKAQPLIEGLSQMACIPKYPKIGIFELHINLQMKYSIRNRHTYCNLTLCDVT